MINLLANNVVGTIGSIILAILILLVMITVHEFGHYIVGTLFNFTINEFSIGFGPALFKRKRKKDGQLFSIRVLPLGGYCAFDGEDDDGETNKKDKKSGDDKERTSDNNADNNTEDNTLNNAQNNIVIDSTASGENSLTSDQPLTNNAEDDIKENIAYTEQTECAEKEEKYNPNSFNNKPAWQRILVLLAGATMNYLLALVVIIISFLSFGQMSYKINSVTESEDYSTEYSLVAGDVLLSVEGRNLYVITDGMKALNGKVAGDSANLTVLRNGATQDVTITLRSDCNFKNVSETSKFWRALGAGTYSSDETLYWDISVINNRYGFFQSIGRSFAYSFRIGGTIFTTLGELLTGNLSISAVGGPITTIKTTATVASRGVQSFFEIVAYIGVNLAVFNLLPIPALDGSKVVFCLIEWVARKPVPRKIEAVIHAVGFFLILGFAILVDILQFI